MRLKESSLLLQNNIHHETIHEAETDTNEQSDHDEDDIKQNSVTDGEAETYSPMKRTISQ